MEATSEPQPLNIRKVFREARRILKSQGWTFLALAFLFVFPSSLATVLLPVLVKSPSPDAVSKSFHISVLSTDHDEHGQDSQPTTGDPIKIILLAVATLLSSLVFSPCAVGSITYAAFHSFNGETVKLKAAIKSISASFFPLLATTLLIQIIIFVISFTLVFFVVSFVKSTTALLGFAQSNLISSPFLLGFLTAMFVVLVIYLQVNWTLAFPVVVVESTWGFEPLRRSKTLIKGKRGLALTISLIFAFYYLIFLWNNTYTADYAASLSGASRPTTAAEWRNFFLSLAVQFLITSAFLTLIQLYNLIVNTVFYGYCKAVNQGGGAELSGDYFSLPVNDEKVALVV